MEIVLGWFICAVISAAIGSSKGETVSAFIMGIILGPLGILVALLSSGNRIPCPACREKIHKKAAICPHCRTQLTAK